MHVKQDSGSSGPYAFLSQPEFVHPPSATTISPQWHNYSSGWLLTRRLTLSTREPKSCCKFRRLLNLGTTGDKLLRTGSIAVISLGLRTIKAFCDIAFAFGEENFLLTRSSSVSKPSGLTLLAFHLEAAGRAAT